MSKVITAGMAATYEAATLPSNVAAISSRITGFVATVAAKRRSRRDLALLSDQMLADIAIDPAFARPTSRYEISARTMTGLMALR